MEKLNWGEEINPKFSTDRREPRCNCLYCTCSGSEPNATAADLVITVACLGVPYAVQ